MVHKTLSGVPRMFQVWACKQVWSIAPTNYELSRWSTRCPLCPSCMQVRETCAHVLHCTHAGRVDALHATIKLLDQWMKKRGMQGDQGDSNYLHCSLRNPHKRGDMDRGTDHKAIGGHAWAIVIPEHTGSRQGRRHARDPAEGGDPDGNRGTASSRFSGADG